jgi:3-oxoacyl-[acyl-carrier protein] reductase
MTDDEFDSVLQVHVYGTFRVSQEAALRFRDQGTGGSIVNTVSAAHYGNFGQTNYAGSKGAIASMTYTWAVELARYGIRVNAISPSGTTRMSANAKVGGKTVELPFIDPNQNGAFVAFLCSDHADWITGQIFGSGADRAQIVEQPKYGTAMYLPGGLTVEGIVENFKKVFGTRLENVGLMKKPYAFYDGLKPPEKE